MNGVIVLFLLAVIAAYLLNRFRGRLGIKATVASWIVPIVAVAVLLLWLWGSRQGR